MGARALGPRHGGLARVEARRARGAHALRDRDPRRRVGQLVRAAARGPRRRRRAARRRSAPRDQATRRARRSPLRPAALLASKPKANGPARPSAMIVWAPIAPNIEMEY